MQSWSNVALRTIRPPNSTSPSPGLSTTPAIAGEYDDRASTRVPASHAKAGPAGARSAETEHDPVRRAARALVLLVPRRRVTPGGARRRRGRARLSRARPDRPRRRLRLPGVRACGEALRRPPDHRRRADARRPLARHRPRRDGAGLLEPLPAGHGGSCAYPSQGEPAARRARAGPAPPRG